MAALKRGVFLIRHSLCFKNEAAQAHGRRQSKTPMMFDVFLRLYLIQDRVRQM